MELTTNNNEQQVRTEDNGFVKDIKQIVASAKTQAYRTANLMQVTSNWLLGWRIVEQEQQGKNRAEYGAYIIKLASEVLTAEFGKGYSETNIKSFRKFYLTFSDLEIGQALPAQLKKMIQQTPSATSEKGQTPSALGICTKRQHNNGVIVLLTATSTPNIIIVCCKRPMI